MNGVIHNCSHGAGTDHNTRLTEEEMMCKVFNYLDHLIQMMQPQKLLYMAIDGVAPRAKVRAATLKSRLALERGGLFTFPTSGSPFTTHTRDPCSPCSPVRIHSLSWFFLLLPASPIMPARGLTTPRGPLLSRRSVLPSRPPVNVNR